MKFNSKSIISVVVLIAMIFVLLLVLLITEKLLSIWHYLQTAPIWISLVYLIAIIAVATLGLYLYLNLIRPKKNINEIKPVDESSLRESLEFHEQRGVDVEKARQELQELEKRRSEKVFHIALYGSVSSGKSSFIRALMPENEAVDVGVLAGSTQSVQSYQYKNLSIVDLPGMDDPNDDSEKLTRIALDESLRSHVVVFLTDSDLTHTEMNAVKQFKETKKPMVIALNKSDRYASNEQAMIISSLKAKTQDEFPLALISTGGLETVIYEDKDGKRKKKVQKRKSNIVPLLQAIELVVSNNPEILNRFRDATILMMAQEKLNTAQLHFNRSQADDVVKSYTKKAVVGAMASIAPGSDLVIQGALATKMIQAICHLYQVTPRQIEIDQVVRMAGGKAKTSVSLLLAIAGNALKAFPGVGTAVGGVTHAVSYGMIFNALGLAVVESVSTLGVLDGQATQQQFEENLLGPTQKLAKDLAKMALKIERN